MMDSNDLLAHARLCKSNIPDNVSDVQVKKSIDEIFSSLNIAICFFESNGFFDFEIYDEQMSNLVFMKKQCDDLDVLLKNKMKMAILAGYSKLNELVCISAMINMFNMFIENATFFFNEAVFNNLSKYHLESHKSLDGFIKCIPYFIRKIKENRSEKEISSSEKMIAFCEEIYLKKKDNAIFLIKYVKKKSNEIGFSLSKEVVHVFNYFLLFHMAKKNSALEDFFVAHESFESQLDTVDAIDKWAKKSGLCFMADDKDSSFFKMNMS